MPLDAIKITVESIDSPDSWITAEEANSIATSVANENFVKYINNVMKVIHTAAKEGRTSTTHYCTTINDELFDRASEFLSTLGYTTNSNIHKTILFVSWK